LRGLRPAVSLAQEVGARLGLGALLQRCVPVDAGSVEITQGGRVVDPSSAKGPIRIRRVSP